MKNEKSEKADMESHGRAAFTKSGFHTYIYVHMWHIACSLDKYTFEPITKCLLMEK